VGKPIKKAEQAVVERNYNMVSGVCPWVVKLQKNEERKKGKEGMPTQGTLKRIFGKTKGGRKNVQSQVQRRGRHQ